MLGLTRRVRDWQSFQRIRERLLGPNGRVWVEGLDGAAKGYFLAALSQELLEHQRSLLVLAPQHERAEQTYDDLTSFLSQWPRQPHPDLAIFPSLEMLLYDEVSPDANLIRERLTVFERVLSGRPTVVITTPAALLHRTMPVEVMRQALGPEPLRISKGMTLPQEVLSKRLVALGYEREEMIEGPGQFSIRGGIFDLYPSTALAPVRVEYFGDEIESIRRFEVPSQRSAGDVAEQIVLPAREMVITSQAVAQAQPAIESALGQQCSELEARGRREAAGKLRDKVEHDLARLSQQSYFPGVEYYLPYLYPRPSTLLDYLSAETVIAVDEPAHLADHYQTFQRELESVYRSRLEHGALIPLPESLYLPLEAVEEQKVRHPRVWMSLLQPGSLPAHTETVSVSAPPADSFAGKTELLARQVGDWQRSGYVVVAATHQPDRLGELLEEAGLHGLVRENAQEVPQTGQVLLTNRTLQNGFRLPAIKLVVLTDREIFGWQKVRRRARWRPSEAGVPITSLTQLKDGDYVVHINHGIGQYAGLVRQTVEGFEREYLLIRYAGADRLYVPADQIDRVQKYLGGEDERPPLNRLGGNEWERAKRRAKRAARELAKELLETQAARQAQGGHAFSPDQPWQQEMETGFPYEETPDQLQAVEEVKRDMEDSLPADRLICGDVGYGKTEVAIRAAFKAVLDGRQVAVLVPTTVLAQQHYTTFSERLAPYPVRVEMLSRFRKRAEQLKVVEGLRAGAVDIVIGTHRLLSNDIEFKSLGLVVIDEEQRFGVRHKERLKRLRATVDVITMTATPIPRTLHMSLSGLREMSLINDPPEGRMPILTLAREKDDDLIREAIVREVERGGQVYFVHNRIESITHVAEHLRRLLPDLRIAVAHGQLHEDRLEEIMLGFYDGQYDVLLCTTIIESGLDIPNVNTLIVDHADRFGLAQLYQLRGRVGRSSRQAYAYLTWTPYQKLTDQAEKRIAAIKEFSDLGSGFRIALRDLEIRGAGNLLGAEQHGFVLAVGFELYCQMIADAVKEVKGVFERPAPEVLLDLPVDAYLPEDYVPSLNQRVEFYRRMAALRSDQAIAAMREELTDRFGAPLPPSTRNLLRLIRLKLRCIESGVGSMISEQGKVTIRLAEDPQWTPRQVRRMQRMLTESPDPRRKLPAVTVTYDRLVLPNLSYDPNLLIDLLEEIAGRIGQMPREDAPPEREAAVLEELPA